MPSAPPSSALLAKGFRPFFLLAAAFAVLALPLWVAALSGRVVLGGASGALAWHAHELVFGFTVAVIAGFLLTAAGNWTGRETATGGGLALLCGLWLAGRLAMIAAAALPPWLVAVTDLSFLPALALAVGRPIAATRDRRNYGFVAILVALFVANLSYHLATFGIAPGFSRRAPLLAVDLVMLVIIVISARIVPMFTRNATRAPGVENWPAADRAAAAAMVVLIGCEVSLPGSTAAAAAAAVVGLLLAVRARRWGMRHVFGNPLLWILHVGHAWLVVGFVLRAAGGVGLVPSTMGLHALTAGSIGALTLGMMARVTLGHTGRMLAAPRAVAASFIVITVAAVVRVVAPLNASVQLALLTLSGLAWAAAFLVFLLVHASMLVAPRVDGRMG